jgi:hypothetical protein
MNIPEDFAVPICWGRVGATQRITGAAALALVIAAVADARTYTVHLNLHDAAGLLGVHYQTARNWWDELVRKGWIVDEKRQPRGMTGTLGTMFKRAKADENVVTGVYRRVFGIRPGSDERRLMLEQVGTSEGNLRLWKSVCEGWYQAGYNPRDTTGMLDRFGKLAKMARTSPPAPPRHGEGGQEATAPAQEWNWQTGE